MDNAYYITEWIERYEVSFKGEIAKPGDKLKSFGLSYIRLKVHGRSQGTGFRRLKQIANGRRYEVFGIFCKLLEIAGNNRANLRGWLLDEKDNPASIEEIAFIMDAEVEQIQYAFKVLSDKRLNWIAELNFGEFLETSRTSLSNVTEPNRTKHNITKTEEEEKDADATVFSPPVDNSDGTDSDGKKPMSPMQKQVYLYDFLKDYFSTNKKSDLTTFRKIAETVRSRYENGRPDAFDLVGQYLEQSSTANNPIAAFISNMKKERFLIC
jgi:hypothetical protein